MTRSMDARGPIEILEELRSVPAVTEELSRSAIERIVAKHSSVEILPAIRARFGDLAAPDADVVLQLAEAFATPELLESLADALKRQTNLTPERAWHALSILDDAELLDGYPELAERREELEELLETGDQIAEIIAEIEGDRESAAIALEAILAVEPELREEILTDLSEAGESEAVAEFLREVARRLASTSEEAPPSLSGLAARVSDRIVDAWVSAVDSEGEATVVLEKHEGARRVLAFVRCHAEQGIRGIRFVEDDERVEALGDWLATIESDVLEHVPALGIKLLALGAALTTTKLIEDDDLKRSIDRILGGVTSESLGPHRETTLDEPGSSPVFEETEQLAELILDACPHWIDRSPLAAELARETALRDGGGGGGGGGVVDEGDDGGAPDPVRDAGVYRYFFEHRLKSRLGLYAHMLFWMASFWKESGSRELSEAAFDLGRQLSDPQHAVPSHPFVILLTARSFASILAR